MLLCLSASHRSADFAMLEKLAAAERGDVEGFLSRTPEVAGAVIVSTCNRFELYLDLHDEQVDRTLPRLWSGLADAVGASEPALREQLRVVTDAKVPEYLFAVSSGLESVVVGEGEISGQVRRSLEESREAGLTTTRLEQLFQSASTAARGVKHHTELQGAGRSLVRLALDLAASQILDWSRARVLLIGTGNYAGATLKALRDRGVQDVGVYSPSGRAHRFAEREGVRAVEERQFRESVANAELIITCSTAEQPVLDYDTVRRARLAPGRAEASLVIDLGMPRNVDPMVGKLSGVDLLDLEILRRHAPLNDLSAAEAARCVVARAAAEFQATQAEAEVHRGIAALRQHVTDLAESEVSRTQSRLGEPGTIALRRLANTILHAPSVRAKELARQGRGEEFLQAIELLFGVEVPRGPRQDASADAGHDHSGGHDHGAHGQELFDLDAMHALLGVTAHAAASAHAAAHAGIPERGSSALVGRSCPQLCPIHPERLRAASAGER